MSSVLITGGAGFIGSHVLESHLAEGDTIVIVDDLSMGSTENIPTSENVVFFQKSITDYEFMRSLLKEWQFDYIYLLAAIASVADTIDRPLESHFVNQDANVQILEAIRVFELKPQKIIFASSAAVYGNLTYSPKNEAGPVSPLTPYAIDKFATEKFVIAYSQLYGLPVTAFRFFNVYGPRQNPSSPYSGVLSIISEKLKNGRTFSVYGDGNQVRDFVYVKDVVAALRLAGEKVEMNGEVYNIGTGKSRTLIEAISTLEKISGRSLNKKYSDPRPGDIRISEADVQKLHNVGFKTKYSFQQGMFEYWESLK
ncbi:NAD-dependent epimerase/dehydratase family protein [Weissella confusa]|uniref:NAD-dependent epimerase/dehydratase family protein n=1 Tax=Weissella confusa TaxID=1583 RepID=A0AAE2SAY8_WEICO|nr:NAD-dependent epimerase/dehydratase family protein [Weissella confusa]MBJ7633577.1 NAD-dependent epimerase/dehydratase family protein [Weissella confusa]MBJ7646338.1 NAD-dependent epimerase/dehydratase family protein [Weissella confusa]TGE52243.1 epimerase [Weissella confusa]